MIRSRATVVLALSLAIASAHLVRADVRTDQKTKFQLAGVLGRMVNMFGGKGAKDGITSMVAVKGNRKATMNDTTGQIIDLTEEKVYDIDVRKKSYNVTTFAELQRQMAEAERKAAEQATKEQAREKDKPAERDKNAKQMDVEFDIKNTGEKKNINGFDTHQAIVTITIHEKGKTLDQSGGMVMTTDMWLTPRNPAMKELQDFDMRYAQKMARPTVAGASAQDMATAMAIYPEMKTAMAKMAAEGNKIDGTPVLSTMTMDVVKSAEQAAEEAKSGGGSGGGAAPGVGGLLGGLSRRGKKDEPPSARSNFMTATTEVLKLTTDVSADAVAVPAGFKESK